MIEIGPVLCYSWLAGGFVKMIETLRKMSKNRGYHFVFKYLLETRRTSITDIYQLYYRKERVFAKQGVSKEIFHSFFRELHLAGVVDIAIKNKNPVAKWKFDSHSVSSVAIGDQDTLTPLSDSQDNLVIGHTE